MLVEEETRHVNVRFHFVREIHGKVIVLEFRRSEENEADMMTKNPTQKEFEKFSEMLVGKVPEVLLAKVKK